MRKTLPVLFLLIAHSIISAQTENKIPAESNLSKTNVVQQIDYSESVPYQPREFKSEQKSKTKKEKKSKKDSQKGKQIVPPIDIAQNQTSEDSAVVEKVPITIPVSVFDAKGNIVQDLKKSDFKVFVDGQEQEISDFGVSAAPLNLILFLDTSPSTAYKFEELQKYAITLVGQLRPQDKVMVIAFNERAQVLGDLTDDRQQTNQAINKAKFGDGTSLYEAVKYSLQKRINQFNGRKFVIMLTDGVDTTSRAATFEDSLLEAEKNDASFFPVYLDTSQQMIRGRNRSSQSIIDQILTQIPPQNQIGVRIPAGQPMSAEADYERGKQYLSDIAKLSGGRIIAIKNFSKIDNTGFESIFEAFRNQLYIGFNSSGNGVIGQRKKIRVRVNHPNLFVLARGSYLVGEN